MTSATRRATPVQYTRCTDAALTGLRAPGPPVHEGDGARVATDVSVATGADHPETYLADLDQLV